MSSKRAIQRLPLFVACLAMFVSLPGCRAIGDIFKAGVGVGVIAVVVVVALVGGVVALVSRGR